MSSSQCHTVYNITKWFKLQGFFHTIFFFNKYVLNGNLIWPKLFVKIVFVSSWNKENFLSKLLSKGLFVPCSTDGMAPNQVKIPLDRLLCPRAQICRLYRFRLIFRRAKIFLLKPQTSWSHLALIHLQKF